MAASDSDSNAHDTAATDANEACRTDAQDIDLARFNAERRGAIETISMMAGNLRAFLLSRKPAGMAGAPDVGGGES
jgi:hypothetical protein